MTRKNKPGIRYGLGLDIEERGGRVYWNNEDWGRSYQHGDPLPCCGCALSLGRRAQAELCDCRCHDVYKFMQRVPLLLANTQGETNTQ